MCFIKIYCVDIEATRGTKAACQEIKWAASVVNKGGMLAILGFTNQVPAIHDLDLEMHQHSVTMSEWGLTALDTL